MSAASKAKLFLIPNTLGEAPGDASFPPLVAQTVSQLQHFIVEDEKSARRLIKQVAPGIELRGLSIERLNEHTKAEDIDKLLEPLHAGHSLGIISEAGCPGVADPGADAVRRAHLLGYEVVPLVGPCSMVLALMASGLNGQRWRFHGYLPIEHEKRLAALRELDAQVSETAETQIIMDTPYRNQKLLHDIVTICKPAHLLCVAQGLTTAAQSIRTEAIREWRKHESPLAKEPSLFLLCR